MIVARLFFCRRRGIHVMESSLSQPEVEFPVGVSAPARRCERVRVESLVGTEWRCPEARVCERVCNSYIGMGGLEEHESNCVANMAKCGQSEM